MKQFNVVKDTKLVVNVEGTKELICDISILGPDLGMKEYPDSYIRVREAIKNKEQVNIIAENIFRGIQEDEHRKLQQEDGSYIVALPYHGGSRVKIKITKPAMQSDEWDAACIFLGKKLCNAARVDINISARSEEAKVDLNMKLKAIVSNLNKELGDLNEH